MSAHSYFGGKSSDGHYHQIINLIPPHSNYIELFGGKLGIYRHKKPAFRTLVVEKDETLAPYYDSLNFTRFVELDNFTRHLHAPFPVKAYYIGDAFDVLEYCVNDFDHDSNFIYIDPPYPLDSRKSQRPVYRYEFDNLQHQVLCKYLKAFSLANIAISTYANEIYNEEFLGLEHWTTCEVAAQTRQGRVTEQLWMNYATPQELHDYQYLGANYREREDIQRKQKRWLKNFSNLPLLERRAMYEVLAAAIPNPTDNHG
ncbi:MAG: hypothetical protein LCH91_05285 [Bacteroidetes bacterium]|nr:hypothetical protein [Bacteroidota bacterium]